MAEGLPRLQEWMVGKKDFERAQAVPQIVLDLFYEAKRLDILLKVRKKAKQDFDREEAEQDRSVGL